MKRIKGFTLIELLAVIVVLAIIALIATPLVLNLIENAKKGAAEQSATAYVQATENYIMQHKINPEKYELELEENKKHYIYEGHEIESEEDEEVEASETYIEEEIKVDGTTPQDGYVVIGEKGSVRRAYLQISGYLVEREGTICKVAGKTNGQILVTSVVIDNKSITNIELDDTLKLTATVKPNNATNKEVIWRSSNENVATVDQDGLVRAIGIGKTTVSATAGTKFDELEIEVKISSEGLVQSWNLSSLDEDLFKVYKGTPDFHDGYVTLEGNTMLASKENYSIKNNMTIIIKCKNLHYSTSGLTYPGLIINGNGGGSIGSQVVGLYVANNNINLSSGGGDTYVLSTSANPFLENPNEWKIIAIRQDGEKYSLWLNGEKLIEEKRTITTKNTPLYLGGYGNSGSSSSGVYWGFMNGDYSNLSIYERALTDKELIAYNF